MRLTHLTLCFAVLLTIPQLAMAENKMWMTSELISKKPYVIEEVFYVNKSNIASRRIGLDENRRKKILPGGHGRIWDGVYNQNFPNGKPQFSKSYAKGLKHGPSREMYTNGSLKHEVIYENGIKNGPMKSYYQTGIIQKELEFVNDVPEGLVKHYTINGKLKAKQMHYRGAPDFYHTHEFEYYPNGNKRSEYIYDLRNYNGMYRFYQEDGKVDMEIAINTGLLTHMRKYDDTGKVVNQEEKPFSGMLKFYYEDGKILKEELYYNGEVAEYKMYDINGKVIMQSSTPQS